MRSLKLAFLVTFCLLISACAGVTSFEKPGLSIADLTPTKFARDGQVFTLKLKVDNPNALALPVAGLDYALNLAGYEVASGISDKAVRIPARGSGIVEIDIKANVIEIFPQIAKAIMSGERNLSYGLKGKVKLNSLLVKEIPFDQKGEVPFNFGDLLKMKK